MKKNTLSINKLELQVHLGWSEEERQGKQSVFIDIEIRYPDILRACLTDQLADTVCYHQLVDLIREKITPRPFHLIEHLSYEIYQITYPLLPEKSALSVRVLKHPQIEGVKDGVCFSYGDF